MSKRRSSRLLYVIPSAVEESPYYDNVTLRQAQGDEFIPHSLNPRPQGGDSVRRKRGMKNAKNSIKPLKNSIINLAK